jgi:hypothetical protein
MSSSWEVRLGVRREVRLLADFAAVPSNDNTENPRQRELMPSPQLPASVTGNVISHDRWFLDRIATHILAFEGDSHVEWFEGNYQDYEKDYRKRVSADADQPHRIKYRRIDA